MRKTFPIPVVAESPFPAEEEKLFQVIGSPGEMPVFRMPSRREPAAPEDERAAGEIIARLLEELRTYRFADVDGILHSLRYWERKELSRHAVNPSLEARLWFPSHRRSRQPLTAPSGDRGSERLRADYPRLALNELTPGALRVLNETLGEGEVSARIGDFAKVQETAFAGIWRVLIFGSEGELVGDRLEACPIPDLVLEQAEAPAAVEIPPPRASLMNAPALLHEIVDRARRHGETGETHVINLTLLPVTPEDMEYLDAVLGRGKVSLLSRGYGNCRITATNLHGVWWVQYFNASETLILNTLEITTIPEAALAAPEDIADSIERLAECLSALEEG